MKPAYLMTLEEYQKEVAPIIQEYNKFIKKNLQYLSNVDYNGIFYYTFPEALADIEKGALAGSFFRRGEYDKGLTNNEFVRRVWSYRKTSNFDKNYEPEETPVGLTEKKNEYIDKLRKYFTEYEITSQIDKDETKSNKRTIKRAIDNDTYKKLLSEEKVTVEQLEKVSASVGVSLPKRIFSASVLKQKENKKDYEKIYALMPTINKDVLIKMVQEIEEGFKPLEKIIYDRDVKLYHDLILDYLLKSEAEIFKLNEDIPFQNKIFTVERSEERERTFTNNKGEVKRRKETFFVGLTLKDNWEEVVSKEVLAHIESLKIKLLSSIVGNFEKITLPIESINQLHLRAGYKGFEGIFKFTFKNGSSFIFETEAIGAGGYNIQQYHFRYLTKFKDVILADGTKDSGRFGIIENFSQKDLSIQPFGKIVGAQSVNEIIEIVYKTISDKATKFKNPLDLKKEKQGGVGETVVSFNPNTFGTVSFIKVVFNEHLFLSENKNRAVSFLKMIGTPSKYEVVNQMKEGGDLENSKKGINFTEQLIKGEIQNDIKGKSNISRSASIKAASDYLRRSKIANSESKNTKLFKEQETEFLKSYIKENSILFDIKDFNKYLGEGAEQKVYLFDDKNVVKLNNKIFYNSWEDYFTNLLLHNYYFPETAYELIGFVYEEGVLCAVVKQHFVKQTEETDLVEVKQIMEDNGFLNNRNNDYYNPELGIILEDLHDENVLTKDGILYFIDTVFYIKELSENKYESGGSVLLAPNGKPSNLTPEQYNLVRTEAFKKWFGEWETSPETASKMLDDNGEPVVCFHGTPEVGVAVFNKDLVGDNTGNEGHYGYGFYFSLDYREALTYTNSNRFGGEYDESKIMKAFLSIKNPFKANDINHLGKYASEYGYEKEDVAIDSEWLGEKIKSKDEIAYQLYKYILDNGYEKGWELFVAKNGGSSPKGTVLDLNDMSDWANWANKDSQDGISSYIIDDIKTQLGEEPKTIKNYTYINYPNLLHMTNYGDSSRYLTKKMQEDGFDGIVAGSEIVVFESNQIKLADGSNTTFDQNNPDIRFKKGGDLDNSEKEVNFTINTTKDEIYNVLRGKSKVRNGDAIQTATSYLRRSKGASGTSEKSKSDIEEEVILDYITENNLWYNGVLDKSNYLARGMEQLVYLDESRKFVLKTNNAIYYDFYWSRYLDSLLIHNFIFPDTAYELIGFKRSEHGSLMSVVKQHYVDDKESESVDLKDVEELLLKSGFVRTHPAFNAYENKKLEIILGDLHIGNVLTKDNVLYFIDTTIMMKVGHEQLIKGGTMKDRSNIKKIVFEEGNVTGAIINDFYNQWQNIKTEKDHAKWEQKARDTKFGTYGTIGLVEMIKKYEPKFPNDVFKRDFFNEIQRALKKYVKGGNMEKASNVLLPANLKNFVNEIDALLTEGKTLNNPQVEKIAALHSIEDKNLMKELVELAIVLQARKIALQNVDVEKGFKGIVTLYNTQPNLSHRTSESILKQQYSTAAPLAFLMNTYIKLNNNSINEKISAGLESEITFFEPSAGNGLLTIASAPESFVVNEIDSVRFRNLESQGYKKVMSVDASETFKGLTNTFDGIITNPPFGATDIATMFGTFPINSMEQLMALVALQTMKNNGKAAIIIGGHLTYDEKGRVTSGKNRIFYNYLHHHYNVEDCINISGQKLYSRQGTGFAVRAILINGRKEIPEGYAPLLDSTLEATETMSNKIVQTFDDLFARFEKSF